MYMQNNSNGCRKREEVRETKSSGTTAWAVKITVITFFLSSGTSMLSQAVTTYTDLIIAVMLLLFMILIAVVFDGIGVSVTSCDTAAVKKLLQYDKKRVKIAVVLTGNAEKVNNICADVIGDMCGVLCGACGAMIASVTFGHAASALSHFATIITSATVAGLTVGGKAFMKSIAVKNADKYVVMTVKALSLIYNPLRSGKRNKDKKNK